MVHNKTDKKTSEQWYRKLKSDEWRFQNLVILDADGWDKKNFEHSWYEEEISKERFMNRLLKSTVKFSSKNTEG